MPSYKLKTTDIETSAEFTVQAGYHMVSYGSVAQGTGSPVARLQFGTPMGDAKVFADYDTTNASFAVPANGAVLLKPQWLPAGVYRFKLTTPGAGHEGWGHVSEA